MRTCLNAAVLSIAATGACISSSGESPRRASCLAATTSGIVRGITRGATCAFLGIPFAAPPIGEWRWRPPQPVRPWTTPLDASQDPPACPSISPPGSARTRGSEDCLRLNIWAPDPLPAAPAPVIVWLHAGAFVAGSANMPASNGQALAERTGAIIVAPNYRVGPLGFLGHRALTAESPSYASSGNYGFLDQRAALSWVQANIAAFGGNPDNVTIAGQSAGAHSVSLHVVSPKSAGYFGRAIMQSGFASTRWRTLADAESQGNEFAAAVGCTDAPHVLSCLRAKTEAEVLLALPSGQQAFVETGRAQWGPVVDGVDIPDQPRRLYERGAFARVPMIVGTTRDEGWDYVDRSFPAGLSAAVYAATVEGEFGSDDVSGILAMYPASGFESPKHALARLTGDVEAVCEARRIARLVDGMGTRVYLYTFERASVAAGPNVVVHGRDTGFVFGNGLGHDRRDVVLSAAMSAYWSRFAATGDPNGDLSTPTEWPASWHRRLHTGGGEHLVLDSPIRVDRSLREKACDFWEPFFFSSAVGSVPAQNKF